MIWKLTPPPANFNSRPCERGDAQPVMIMPDLKISILAPARGATFRRLKQSASRQISILAPARGATFAGVEHTCDHKFQFSPLREGRPAARVATKRAGSISILAPARGATIKLFIFFRF